MTGRLLTLLVVSPLFIGVSFILLNIFLNMVDPMYAQFTVFKASGYDWTTFLNVPFETTYMTTMNMDYWFIYVVVGGYLVWQGFLSPFYDLTQKILNHKTMQVGRNGVPVDIEATADKEPVSDKIIAQQARANEPTQIQIVPVPMLTQEQLTTLNNLTALNKDGQKSDTVEVSVPTEEAPPAKSEPSEPVEKPSPKFTSPVVAKEKFPTPPKKPRAFKPNRNVDTEQEAQGLGKVYMNVPSEIKELGKKDGD